MPEKPTSTPARSTEAADEDAASSSASKSIAEKKQEALSLIDDEGKLKRRRRRKAAVAEEDPAAAEQKPVEEVKKEALSLYEEVERREESRRKGRKRTLDEDELGKKKSGDVLPPISRLQAEREEAEAGPKPEAVEVAADDEEDDDEEGETESNVIHIKPPIIVKELAERMGVKPFKLIKDLIELEVFADTNKSIDADIAARLCEKHGFVFEKEKRAKGSGVHKVEEVVEEPAPPEEEPEDELRFRAPIVTFMGHVDHGKTSLLDAIRKTSVTEDEAGGITQHIGAYMVECNGAPITFLDTPGHAAFTEMRARGANVTDIVVLVVAADDGVMPQTREAIDHAKAAGVKIVVALNKIDLPRADANRVKGQLQEVGLAPEEWGGDTAVMEVSATKGTGIDTLLEHLQLEAEVLELRANPDGHARAPVIEARVEPGKGPTATVIVQSGTLGVGTAFICGPHYGKVKSLISDRGEMLKSAGPATPVEVLGFSAVPNVGDELVEMESERAAKKLSEERQQDLRQKKLARPARSSLENLFANAGVQRPALRLVLKCDVQGSVEAVSNSLREIKSEKISLDILHAAAGSITESDVLLASASDAVVVGFNTKVESNAVRVAKSEGIQIKLYSIIYELIDQVKEAMMGLLAPEHRETIVGHAEVKQVFKLSRGKVGGCLVTDGRIARSARARVVRDGQPVYDGGLATLKRFQDDVTEVRNGLECGIKLGDFNDYEVGDIIECYELERLEQTL